MQRVSDVERLSPKRVLLKAADYGVLRLDASRAPVTNTIRFLSPIPGPSSRALLKAVSSHRTPKSLVTRGYSVR